MYRDQRGTIGILVVGFCAIVALLVVVVTDASAAYLRRQSLASLADATALAAADGAKAASAYTGGPLSTPAARRAATAYLADAAAAARYPGLTLEVGSDGEHILVTLRTPLRLPIAPPGWQGSLVVARSAAYVVVG